MEKTKENPKPVGLLDPKEGETPVEEPLVIEAQEENIEVEEGKNFRPISITLPDKLIEEIEDYADAHSLTRSSTIRRAVEHYLKGEGPSLADLSQSLKRIEALLSGPAPSPAPSLIEDKTKDVEMLFEDCIVEGWDEEQVFELDGNQGFFARCKERNLIGPIWTDELLTRYAYMLKLGHDGYLSPPSYDSLIQRSVEAMGLDEKQKAFLKAKIDQLEGSSESESAEEDFEEE